MLNSFFPRVYYESVFKIDLLDLENKNIRGIIFDIDNTLEPFDIKHPDEKIEDFLLNLKHRGFQVSLVSNNKKDRVRIFNEKLQLPAVSNAGKPGLKGLTKAMNLMGTQIETTAFVGDQIYTDVWAGNRMGVYSILVKPICNRDEWTVKIKRVFEKPILKEYFKRIGV